MNAQRWIGYCQTILDRSELTFRNLICWAYANPSPNKGGFPHSWRPILLYSKGAPAFLEPLMMPMGSHSTIYYDPGHATSPFLHDLWTDIPKLVGGIFAQAELLTDSRGQFKHPAQMPEAIARRILLTSVPPGGSILDPMAGSGTVLKAAQDLGYRATGIERSEAYCDMICARLAQQPLDI